MIHSKHIGLFVLAVLMTVSFSKSASAKMVKKAAVPIIGDASTFQPGDGSGEKGDVILTQRFVAAETAQLEASFNLSRKKFDAKHNISSDEILYQINFQKDKIGYCTFNDTFSQKPKIGALWTAQTCFSDEDGDGKLDREFSAQKNPDMFPRLSVNLLWSDEVNFPPVSIVKAGPNASVGVDAEIRLAKISSKKVRFELHLETAEGAFKSHATQSIKFTKDETFPKIVEVFGAKLRIDNVGKDKLEYTVMSGFSKTREIALLKYMSLDDMFEVFFLDEWEY